MRHGRLADLLPVLGVEPLDAGLVRGSNGLAVGPTAQGATLVQGQGVALLEGAGKGLSQAGDRGGHQRRVRRGIRHAQRLFRGDALAALNAIVVTDERCGIISIKETTLFLTN